MYKKFTLAFILTFGFIFSMENKFSFNEVENKYHFELGELDIVEKDGNSTFKSEGYGSIAIEGLPDLPIFSTYHQVQRGKSVQVNVNIKNSEIIENVYLASFQLKKHENQKQRYISEMNFPSENILISDVMVMRDISFVKISYIPFNYNTTNSTLEIFNSVEFEINEIDIEYNDNEITRKPSKVFDKIYSNLNTNQDLRENEEYQNPAVLYICGGNIINNPYFEDLVEWRRQRGFTVYSESVSSIGNTTNDIKSYIQNAYYNLDPAPEYVTLIGDVGGSYDIPTYQGGNYGFGHNDYNNNCEGDHPYSQLDGNDLYPEVLLGRMSIRTADEFANMVNKILIYEKATYMDFAPNYYQAASLVGDPASGSGNSTGITNEYIAELLTNHGFDDVRIKISGNGYDSWMKNNLQDGMLFFNYRGFLGVSGFDNSDIDDVNNGFMLPFATVLTCGTNSFAEDPASLTEYFVRAGTVNNPKGAVAAVGTATWNTHTLFNNIVNMGMFDGLFGKKLETAGAALANGKLALDITYPGDPDNWISAFTHWNNLIGDPTTHLWTSLPKLMNVNHNSSISYGTNYINVAVQDNYGNPLNDARVTLYRNNEIFINNFTDEEGDVDVPLNYITPGEVSVVVTMQGYKPYISTLSVENLDNGVVNLSQELNVQINDENGNNNQEINPGEYIQLSVPLTNFGNANLTNINVNILSSSNAIEILNGTYQLNALNSGSSIQINDFSFQVNQSVAHNEDLELLLIITSGEQSWSSKLNLFVQSYDFDLVNIFSDDGSAINPGEIQGLNINLINSGMILSEPVTGILSTNYTEVSVTVGEVNWNVLSPGSISPSNGLFELNISNNVVNGTSVSFVLSLTAQSGYTKEIFFDMDIGRISNLDPSGPDQYGYYIYDSNDLNYDLAPTYEWIEIDPNLGGSGQSLNLNHNGNGEWGGNGPSTQVDLPFEFSFYGIEYDVITICTNGWIAFGESNSEAFRNYSIPGAGGPPAMVAVFWDDLKTSQGNVYTYSDPNNEFFIIEWSNMRTYDQNSDEDFQIILYNNPVMPHGDGEMKLQYKTFNNTSIGDFNAYPPRHGSYATIGIENHLTDIGMEYSFYNNYMQGASVLSDGSALFITTRSPIPLPSPELTYSIDNMDLTLNMDNAAVSQLNISNTGEEGSFITYSVSKTGVNPFQNIGGNDSYGYVWSDTDLEEDMYYQWLDIDINDDNLVSFPNNDFSSEQIPIGFEFKFYGQQYSNIIVNPNGWIGFGEDNTEFNNTSLPSNSAPRPAIFGYWDDLNPVAIDPGGCSNNGSGLVYKQNLGDKFVVWYNNVVRCTSNPDLSGTFDFQIVLHSNGDIDINYRNMSGNTTSGTVGMQNADGTIAIVNAYDSDYVESEKTIQYKELDDVNWLYFDGPTSGQIENGESQTINIITDTEGLNVGLYQAEILLSTSVEPTLNIPVNMTVTDYVLLGDVNFDEQINVTDIVLIVSFILEQLTFDSNQEFSSDINGDGNTNVVDIVLLVELILQ